MAAGADPVELTIEKFSLLANLDEIPEDLCIGCAACPLCIDKRVTGYRDIEKCIDCPLNLISGDSCFNGNTLYRAISHAQASDNITAFTKACTAMVDALKRYQRIKNA